MLKMSSGVELTLVIPVYPASAAVELALVRGQYQKEVFPWCKCYLGTELGSLLL